MDYYPIFSKRISSDISETVAELLSDEFNKVFDADNHLDMEQRKGVLDTALRFVDIDASVELANGIPLFIGKEGRIAQAFFLSVRYQVEKDTYSSAETKRENLMSIMDASVRYERSQNNPYGLLAYTLNR